ncbi:hypothetical protein GO730_00475 [Spirosoma sp. HMF3257]|uniref:hypothetical protein n=1 Tax=Spirosoma telluris TaxID=2183553 RepID=UPI0011B94C1B|nr:hypothetical protein [Spirosoma telluris]
MNLTQLGTAAFMTTARPSASVSFPEGNQDANSVKGLIKKPVSAGGKSYNIYPWGTNNQLPNEMINLYRSNGDVMNLVQTRADFLFGAGVGWFKHSLDGKDTVMTPYTDDKIKAFEEFNDLQELANGQMTYLVESGNAFINHSREGGKLMLSLRDSLTVRAAMATQGFVDTWLLAPDWVWSKRQWRCLPGPRKPRTHPKHWFSSNASKRANSITVSPFGGRQRNGFGSLTGCRGFTIMASIPSIMSLKFAGWRSHSLTSLVAIPTRAKTPSERNSTGR